VTSSYTSSNPFGGGPINVSASGGRSATIGLGWTGEDQFYEFSCNEDVLSNGDTVRYRRVSAGANWDCDDLDPDVGACP
jgi:hypothetical protein